MAQDARSLLELTATIVRSYAGHNVVPADQLPELMGEIHAALSRLERDGAPPVKAEPVVPINRSVRRHEILCLECGRGFKTLRRHLATSHGLSPAGYRARFDLRRDYPLVAADYAERRSDMAKKIGLGRKATARRRRRKTAV